MIGNWVLDDLEELLLRVGRAYGESMKQLHHQTSETFEGAGNANGWTDLDQDTFGGVYVYLQLSGFVDRRVEQGKETLRDRSGCHCKPSTDPARVREVVHPNLMSNVRTGVADVSVHFPHDTNVFVAVQ